LLSLELQTHSEKEIVIFLMIYFKDNGIINAKQDYLGFLKNVFLQGFA